MATFFGTQKQRASKRAASRASRARADAKNKSSSSKSSGSSSGKTSNESSGLSGAVTRPDGSGGTITVTSSGKVTERDSQGNITNTFAGDTQKTSSFVKS